MLTAPALNPPRTDAQACRQPRRFSPDSEATSGIRVLFGVLPLASISVADFARLSRAWPAGRRDAAAVRGRHRARVIAHGGVAAGIVATAGVIALGAIGVGAFSFGALSLGIFVLARLATGWRPVGALAFGHATVGGPALGRHAYGLGIAFGCREASGKQEESLFG